MSGIRWVRPVRTGWVGIVWLVAWLGLSSLGAAQQQQPQAASTQAAWSQYEARLAQAHQRLLSAKPTGPDARTREAILAYFSGNRKALADLYTQLKAQEDASGDARDLRPSDSVLYLFNSTLRDREQFLLGQEIAAREARSDELRTRILLSMLDDEYYEINQLKGQNRFNKFTRIFNRASQSLSKLALFQPQDAAQLLLDAVYSFRKAKDTTERERKIVFLANAFLDKYPKAAERPEVEELLNQLRAKLNLDRAEREKTTGKIYLEKGEFVPARFHLENAVIANSSDTEAQRLWTQAGMQDSAQREAAANSLGVLPGEQNLGASEKDVFAQAARALVLGNGEQLQKTLGRSPRLQDSVLYALTAVAEQRGGHDMALGQLATLSQSAPQTPGGRAARAALANPDYNLDEGFAQAVEEMRKKRKQYILTGKRAMDDNAYIFGSAAVQGPAGMPALFVTDMLVRGVAEQFKTQISVDEVVDAGARYIRKYPKSQRSRDIAYQVAQLSQRSGADERSENYLKLAEADTPKSIAKLHENEARKYYDSAQASKESGNLIECKRYLEYVCQHYGECKIAKTARKELDKLPPTLGEEAISLPRKALASDPAFVEALGVSRVLVDGKKSNGEIADEGMAVRPSDGSFSYRLKDGTQFYSGRIPGSQSEALLARARALSAQSDFRNSGQDALHRQVVPLALDGGAGSGGVDLSPKLVPYKDLKDAKQYK